MGSPISETWTYATMLVENEWGHMGTGFLVYRAIDEKSGRIFLVTNKHVLHSQREKRMSAKWIVLHLNMKSEDGSIIGQSGKIPLNLMDGSKSWREHPDRDVDVLAIDVTPLVVNYPKIEKKWATYSDFADKAKLKELEITAADEVVVVGYPIGLHQGASYLPLIRNGMIASRIGETLEDEILESDRSKRKRTIRGFLVDGAFTPGSSGSPVILKPVTGRIVGGNIILGSPPPILLGILSETKYGFVETETGEFQYLVGLALAFDAEMVKETVEQFFT